MLTRRYIYLVSLLQLLNSCNTSASYITDSVIDSSSEHTVSSAVGLVNNDNSYATVSFASSNQRYNPEQQVFSKPLLQYQLTAWKADRVSCQVLVWAKKSLSGVRVVPSSKNKAYLAVHDVFSYGTINYVSANYSGGMCGSVSKDLPEIKIADAISPQTDISIEAGKMKSIWLNFDIPSKVLDGNYTINLAFQNRENYNLPTLSMNIQVKNHTLPPPPQWAFHLDLWQYPLRVARYYKVKPWTEEHFNALQPSMQQLADAGQKTITASFFWDNTNHENWGYENLMVRINKQADGTFQYDFGNFDKWVSFMMSLGIKDQINCFGMYPFTNKLEYYYTDGKVTSKTSLALSSDSYKSFWMSLLKEFARHLKEKGWMDKAVLYFDERPPKAVIEIVTLIKQADPAFKIGYAGGYNATLNPFLNDFSIVSYLKIDKTALAQRRQQKKITTFYTTCLEKKPNLFTYSDPAEAAFMGLFAYANEYDGYLRYAFDMWEANSLMDTRSSIVPAGDKFIIYPQGYSSVRFEKLVEGIRYFEKLRILKNEFVRANKKEELKKLESLLISFKRDNIKEAANYTELVSSAKKFIDSY